ncbi:MAG: hypothetical protein ACLRIS_10175 [Flavonifractor plautii]
MPRNLDLPLIGIVAAALVVALVVAWCHSGGKTWPFGSRRWMYPGRPPHADHPIPAWADWPSSWASCSASCSFWT